MAVVVVVFGGDGGEGGEGGDGGDGVDARVSLNSWCSSV